MSSCPKSIITEDEARTVRVQEIKTLSKEFLREVVTNLCLPEGPSGRLDIAFSIDRSKIIAEVLKELSEELEEQSE